MKHLARRISPFTLFMLSMNAIIGSGWLFAPLYATKIAGAGAIISWIIGGMAASLVALTFAELSTMFPVAGGTASIPQFSHGTFVSFLLSWIAWLSCVILAPIEVQAVLQYGSLFFPSLMHVVNDTPYLTPIGFLWATILMLSLCLINVLSYRGLMRFNFILFVFKFAVILVTIFAIIHTRFNPHNFSGIVPSMQSTAGWQMILSAVATAGIAFAFNGFKSGVELAGETKNLKIAIPLSTVGAVCACLIIYIGLQICFIGALNTEVFSNGFHHLHATSEFGPFAGFSSKYWSYLACKIIICRCGSFTLWCWLNLCDINSTCLICHE